VYLVDTNIFLEVLLDQARADKADAWLKRASAGMLSMTEFTLYSLGIILLRLRRPATFLKLKNDLLGNGAIRLLRLGPDDMESVIEAAHRFNLDFDDAYQYQAATKHDLQIVSFDSDFDKTDRGRTTPGDLISR
jgi:hypothetical protein